LIITHLVLNCNATEYEKKKNHEHCSANLDMQHLEKGLVIFSELSFLPKKKTVSKLMCFYILLLMKSYYPKMKLFSQAAVLLSLLNN